MEKIDKNLVLEAILKGGVTGNQYSLIKQLIKALPTSDGWVSVENDGYPKTQGDGIEYLCAYEKSTRLGIFNYAVLWYENNKWMNCKYDDFDCNQDLLSVTYYKQITDPTPPTK